MKIIIKNNRWNTVGDVFGSIQYFQLNFYPTDSLEEFNKRHPHPIGTRNGCVAREAEV